MKTELFEQLTRSLKEAGEIKRGTLRASRTTKLPPHRELVQARGELGLSQSEFAALLGISKDTLQNWEQGRRKPTGPAKVLLRIAVKHPQILLETA